MDEYIEREAAIAAIMSEPPDAHYPQWYADKIKDIPAANVAQVRHGNWCWEGRFRACSICGSYVEFTETLSANHWNYCPVCGAKMDLEV